MSPVIETISLHHPLSLKAIEDLRSIMQFKKVAQNELLLHTGEVATNVYFTTNGLLRMFYFHEGKDVTDYFAPGGHFICSLESLVHQVPSDKAVHAVTASEVYYFSLRDFDKCCAQNHDLEHASRKLLMEAMAEEQKRVAELRFYSAKERYEQLEMKFPGIINHCPLKYIASYLNISQVSISRVRAGVQ